MPPTSLILRQLDTGGPGSMELANLLAAMGSRAHGVALLLLALPDTLPLPLPSTSTVLGVPLVIIAAHLVLYGEGSRLPDRVGRLKIPHRVLHVLARYAAPVLESLERISRPRLLFLLRSDRAIGIVAWYLSVLLLLPVPLMNTAPAVCLVALALGMLQRDGLIVAAGLVSTLVLTIMLVFFADFIESVVSSF